MGRLLRASLVALSATALLSAGCTQELDTAKGEQEIREYVESNYEQVQVQDAECPERPAKKGDVFECTARFDGQVLRFKVTQEDDEGRVTIEPAQAVVDTDRVEADIARVIRQQAGVDATVDCGSQRLFVKDPGATFDCQAADARGATRRIVVTVKDVQGNADYRLA